MKSSRYDAPVKVFKILVSEDEDGALMIIALNPGGAFFTIGAFGTNLAAALARLCQAVLCSLATP